MAVIKNFFKALIRRKPISVGLCETQLNRCLSTLDLTALGIGSTLGLGIYVIAGQVASEKAGPSVILSFFIAALASVFAGLCYAEFGARVPRAGSAYVYSYVTVGEFMAFIIGWNLVLEYVIGTASVARGYSGYIDSLFNGTIQKHLQEAMPMHLTDVSPYPDFLAFGITLLLTIMLAAGVRESSRFNNLFTCLNLLVVLFAIVAGSIKSDVRNWKLDESEVPEGAGKGGFFPYGISGMMAGAATCFYGFIGFDCIATTGEEVKNPQKSIPISIVLSLFFVFLAYFGVSTVQTLMVPYYLQDNPAPLPYVFESVGWHWASWIITIGALAGLSTSLLGAMFPLPRVLYAMASDGVIFRFFSKIHPRFQTPLIATIFSGLFSGGMAMMFNVRELADMMSIGTLLAYTLVAVSVLMLRYQSDENASSDRSPQTVYKSIAQSNEKCEAEENGRKKSYLSDALDVPLEKLTYLSVIKQLLNIDGIETPNKLTSRISCALIATLCSLVVMLDGLLAWTENELMSYDIMTLSSVAFLTLLVLIFLFLLHRQPVENKTLSFKVPLIPFVPILSVLINVYLMFKLSLLTWKRFGAWMVAGFLVYFLYGIWHSSERNNRAGTASVYTVTSDGNLIQKTDSEFCNNGPKRSIDSHISELASSCESPASKLISQNPAENSSV